MQRGFARLQRSPHTTPSTAALEGARGTCGTAVGRRAPRRCGRRTRVGTSSGCPGHTAQAISRRSPRLSMTGHRLGAGCAHSAEPELLRLFPRGVRGRRCTVMPGRCGGFVQVTRVRAQAATAAAQTGGLGGGQAWRAWALLCCGSVGTTMLAQCCTHHHNLAHVPTQKLGIGRDDGSRLTLLQSATDGGT